MLPSPVLGIGLQYPSKSPPQLRSIQDTITRSRKSSRHVSKRRNQPAATGTGNDGGSDCPARGHFSTGTTSFPNEVLLSYLVQFSWQTLITL